MRALTLTSHGSLDQLRVQDVPDPVISAPDQVRISMRAAALNRLDLFVLQGLPGVALQFPHVMGGDGAGVVESVGAAVTRFQPRDRVMINPGLSCWNCEYCLAGEQSLCVSYRLLGEHVPGSIAELLVLPERNLAPVPEGMPWEKAAAFSLATLTAWRMLANRAAVRAGETVLIWGIGGGVSLAALQIAKLLGARVIATSSSDAKLAAATTLGADVTLNYTTTDVPRQVRELTARRGVEVVVENVGERTWEQSLRCLGRMGRLVTCGATTGPMVVTDVRKLFWYQWSIFGSTMGNYTEYQEISRLAGQGKLWPLVDSVVPLDRAADAFARLASGAQLGKLVIEVSS
ncbi:MAG: zinc-binding dehydrogenase [Gemmatimonadota bacterium]